MADFESPLDGDVVINNELEIPIGEIIAFLEQDPRFETLVRNVILKNARKKGNSFGSWAQQTNPPQTNTKRLN